jgi:hypothetical protein
MTKPTRPIDVNNIMFVIAQRVIDSKSRESNGCEYHAAWTSRGSMGGYNMFVTYYLITCIERLLNVKSRDSGMCQSPKDNT